VGAGIEEEEEEEEEEESIELLIRSYQYSQRQAG
jgi:hypothetical protein